jgi:hypothetical protein
MLIGYCYHQAKSSFDSWNISDGLALILDLDLYFMRRLLQLASPVSALNSNNNQVTLHTTHQLGRSA